MLLYSCQPHVHYHLFFCISNSIHRIVNVANLKIYGFVPMPVKMPRNAFLCFMLCETSVHVILCRILREARDIAISEKERAVAVEKRDEYQIRATSAGVRLCSNFFD